MTSKIPIAVLGLGLIGPRHALAVLNCPSASLCGIVDPSPRALEVISNTPALSSIRLFKSIEDLLSESPIRPIGAIICTPNHTHATLASKLVEAGVHVLIEKPIADSVLGAKSLLKLANDRGAHLLVGHHRRFHPIASAAKQVLDSGRLGRPLAVQGIWALRKPDSYFEPLTKWRAQADSGGVVLINLVHELDILLFLFGPIEHVAAEKAPTIRGEAHQAEEGAAVLVKFESGVVGTFVVSDASPSPWSWEVGTGENPMIPKGHGREGRGVEGVYRVLGTKKSLSLPDMTIWGHENELDWREKLTGEEINLMEVVPFDAQVENFVKVIKGEDNPRCSGVDGLLALAACDAVKNALRDGGFVKCERL